VWNFDAARPQAARAQARRALELLDDDAESAERIERLRALGACAEERDAAGRAV